MDNLEVLSRMTVSEFRAFKRAVAVLVRAGMPYAEAVNSLLVLRLVKGA